MDISGDLIHLGFLGIGGFGVWRGQSLWSHHIELKHAREMERLSMDRMEKSIRLEIDQNKGMAEIARMQEMPALPAGETAFDPSALPFVCGCGDSPSWHMHAIKKAKEEVLIMSLGAIEAIRDGRFARTCLCGTNVGIVHVHAGISDAETSLSAAGYTVKAKK